MMNEPVSTIMTRKLITVSPQHQLSTAREILIKHRIHHLPVVEDDDRLAGLITTYDLFKTNVSPEEFDKMTVGEIMTVKLATLEPTAKVGTAAEIFLDHLFHALPIVKGDRLVGIVTTHDVLKYNFKKEYPKHLVYKDKVY